MRGRDRSFLYMAWLAGLGALLDLLFSVGIPLERAAHHEPWTPAFFFFSVWGWVALAGCVACVVTYRQSGPAPGDRPPHGGVRPPAFTLIEGGGGAKTEETSEHTKRAA